MKNDLSLWDSALLWPAAPLVVTLVAMILFAPAHAAGSPAPSEQDRAAAEALNAEGDAAYRAGRFDKALRAYMNAYPNHPNAHAYLMAGDAYWRGVLAIHARSISNGSPKGCALNNRHFAEDARRSLDQHYRPGLVLAGRDTPTTDGQHALVERSTQIAACLTGVQEKYAALPKTECVDLREVSACLGEPLRP